MRSKEAIRLRILELCDQRNLTVNRLSGICGMTQSTLNNIVNGRNNSVTVATIQKICDGLEMNLPEFFDTEYFRDIEQEIF